MTHRRSGKIYDKWHRRVEGQIRHVIGQHPEWFNIKNEHERFVIVNSIAKRIVGEIVADLKLASISKVGGAILLLSMPCDDACEVLSSGRGMALKCSPSESKQEI